MDMVTELSNRALKAHTVIVGVHMDLLEAYYDDHDLTIGDVAEVIATLEGGDPPSEATTYRRLREWRKKYYGIVDDWRSVRARRTELARMGLAHQHLFGFWDDESWTCRCEARRPFTPDCDPRVDEM